ncbi:uncharacterized protein LOC126908366 [Daktulosphaira vitifoliae]|uniref:uncharacterized protein LOC126908366 n=1 Tax=Daktulosphaira vitifoliae TaxID=58002 RepID=UPI0021AAB6B6|nr:uncharacterized protein LOC126908366 [Daktulosphaira vitifoliae]
MRVAIPQSVAWPKSSPLMLKNIEPLSNKNIKSKKNHKLLQNMNENIETHINDIKHLTLHRKVKRSWEGAGSAIKWLFGNADAEDVKRYDNMINKLDNDENDILRIVHDQNGAIKETVERSEYIKKIFKIK